MNAAAPLLCAGITVYTPMKDSKLLELRGVPKKVGIIGLGGLGHVAVKFAKAFGHHLTIISTSPSKESEARQHLGADDFIVSTDPKQMMVRVPLIYIVMVLFISLSLYLLFTYNLMLFIL